MFLWEKDILILKNEYLVNMVQAKMKCNACNDMT